MKRCPTCNQTFEEEWLSFCTDDGTTLIEESISAGEPPPTIMATPSELASLDAAWSGAPSVDQWQPPPPVAPAWQPPPPPAFVQPPNKSLATASLVIGIISVTVGWLCLGPIPGIAAIILGAVALSQMKKNPDGVGGKQSAVIGIVTGSITVLFYIGFMIFYIVVMIAANA